MGVDENLLYQMVGERVKRARKAAGLSQAKLAKKLGMSRTSVVNIEAGRQRPPLHVLWNIAEHVRTEPALLVPRLDEYEAIGKPVKLDADTIEQIERAASGDPATRRDLTRFIANARARAKEVQ
jgi:transcriptional regulator with XRE-family HTH domain